MLYNTMSKCPTEVTQKVLTLYNISNNTSHTELSQFFYELQWLKKKSIYIRHIFLAQVKRHGLVVVSGMAL